MNYQQLADFLNTPPAENEICFNEDGSRYLPIDVVKRKLTALCGFNWSTTSFRHFFYMDSMGNNYVSGSITLSVGFIIEGDSNVEVKRHLSGSATFSFKKFDDNKHFGATCKSLCIVNAAQDLGVAFGLGLNDEFEAAQKNAKDEKIKETLSFLNKQQ